MPDEKSYNYFLDNKERLMQKYKGMYLIISKGEFRAAYLDEIAVEGNARKYGDDLLILHLNPNGITEYMLK